MNYTKKKKNEPVFVVHRSSEQKPDELLLQNFIEDDQRRLEK